MSGILTDTAIASAVACGDIEIDPFNEEQLNSVSYDLTLGDKVAVYNAWTETFTKGMVKTDAQDGVRFKPVQRVLDTKKPASVEVFQIDPENGWVLLPDIGYLMYTKERVHTKKFVPILDGKSSIGRLFVQIHSCAGFGEPGFNGNFTLEVMVRHPLRVYPGMRFCQIRFQGYTGVCDRTYDKVGHYVGDFSKGPIASLAWKQFDKS